MVCSEQSECKQWQMVSILLIGEEDDHQMFIRKYNFVPNKWSLQYTASEIDTFLLKIYNYCYQLLYTKKRYNYKQIGLYIFVHIDITTSFEVTKYIVLCL